jgi:hypothetical protein
LIDLWPWSLLQQCCNLVLIMSSIKENLLAPSIQKRITDDLEKRNCKIMMGLGFGV